MTSKLSADEGAFELDVEDAAARGGVGKDLGEVQLDVVEARIREGNLVGEAALLPGLGLVEDVVGRAGDLDGVAVLLPDAVRVLDVQISDGIDVLIAPGVHAEEELVLLHPTTPP